MPRSLTAAQTERVEQRALAPLPLLTITTFTNYTARTVDTVYRFSDTGFTDADGNVFQPFLIEADTNFDQSMNHLPDPTGSAVGQLYRDFEFRLRNGEFTDTGKRLITELEDHNIQFAEVEYAQLLLDRSKLETEQEAAAAIATSEKVVFFRGEVFVIGEVDSDVIPITCVARLFQGGLATDAITDGTVTGTFSGIGARHQVVYGDVKRVPSLAVQVGGITTLRLRMNDDASEFFVSDPLVLDQTAGTVYVAGEPIDYTGLTGDRVFGLTRNVSLSAEHFAGDTVAFVPSVITYSVAANASQIGSVFVRNPLNDAIVKVSTAITKVIADQNTIVGQTFSSVSWTAATWRELLDNWVTNARVTGDAAYESGTPPVSGNDSANNVTASSEFQAQGRVDDGNWSAEVWTWTSDGSGPKRMKRKGPFVAADAGRGVSRFRMIASVQVTVSSGPTKADFSITYINSGLGINRTDTFSTLAVQTHNVEGAWVNTDPAAVTVGDVDGGTWEYGFADVDPDDDVSTFVAEILTIGFEYDFIDAANLILLATPAQIQAQSGGAGVEMYADILGPLVPILFTAGYDFDTGTGWGVTNCAQTDGTTFQSFKADETVTVEFTLNGDAINWTTTAGSTLSDEVVATIDCLRIASLIDVASNAARTFAAEDWSDRVLSFDIYLDSAEIDGFKELQWRVESTGGFHQFNFLPADIPKNVWTTRTMNLADPTSDPNFAFSGGTPDMSAVNEFSLELPEDQPTHPIFEVNLSNIVTSVGDHDTFNAQINPGASSTDLDADNDVYRLTVRTLEWGAFDEAKVIFSNENVTHPTSPTAFKQLTFDPSSLQSGVLTKLELTATDVGTPSVNNVRTVRIEVDGLVVSTGTLELHDLQVAEAVNSYVDALDDLVQLPPDVVRHFLTERAGIDNSQIDATTFNEAGVNLSGTQVAAVLSELSEDDVTAMLRLGYGHRFQLVQYDDDTETIYKLLTAQKPNTFPVPTITLTEWQEITREGRLGGEIVNRRLFLYSIDRSRQGTGVEPYNKAIQIDAQINQSTIVDDTLLANSEDLLGPRVAPSIALLTIDDDATAQDTTAYYTLEELREARIYNVRGVPWTQGYALERGDIVSFTPEWSSVAVSARLISVTKDTKTELVDLRAVEVETA